MADSDFIRLTKRSRTRLDVAMLYGDSVAAKPREALPPIVFFLRKSLIRSVWDHGEFRTIIVDGRDDRFDVLETSDEIGQQLMVSNGR